MAIEISTNLSNSARPIPAAEYVRMSTDQQQFSIAYQQAAIRLYAAQRGMAVIRTYADEGLSGLTLRERPAMIQLLNDVELGPPAFEIILVYDVSRWGRYQDTDEGAFYEFRCRRAGTRVEYCAEQFSSEISPLNTVLKAIKRAMAAEYSRELAVRTHSAQARGSAQGFLQGGIAGYGLRRMLVDGHGQTKGLLPPGAAKSFRTDRVVLVPGPQEEVDVIRRIFDLFVNKHMFKRRIAQLLNREGIPFSGGRQWNEHHVRFLLSNERYTGTLVFGKTSSLLRLGKGHGRVRSPPGTVIHGSAGYPPLVSPEIFAAANEPKSKPGWWYSDAALLEALNRLRRQHGYLSHRLIETTTGLPSPQTYRKRFGTLREAYKRIGYLEQTNHLRLKHYDHTRKLVLRVVHKIQSAAKAAKRVNVWNWQRRTITFESGSLLRITLARYLSTRQNRRPRWEVETNIRIPRHFLIIIRMDAEHQGVLDYYFLPSSVLTKRLNFFDQRNIFVPYRCKNLKDLIARASECPDEMKL
jgi:DNA invertase Pin-like site-specific DNA recombinase